MSELLVHEIPPARSHRGRLTATRAAARWLAGMLAVVAALLAAPGTPAHAATSGAAQSARIAAQVKAGNPAIRTLAQKSGWKYKTYQATACYGYKHPFWGKSRNTPGCTVAHFTLTGEVAYNGKQAWGQWIDYGTGHVYGVSVKKTWLGFWNNGAIRSPYFVDLGANGHVSVKFWGSNDFYLRIDVHRNGTAALRGGAK